MKQSPRVNILDFAVWTNLGFSCDCAESEHRCLMAQGRRYHFLPCIALVFSFDLDYHHQDFVPSIVPLVVDSSTLRQRLCHPSSEI